MYFFGLELTTATDTALFANGEIAFSILLAMLFFKERLRLIGYLAVTMVLLGIIIVTTDIPFSLSIPVFSCNFGNGILGNRQQSKQKYYKQSKCSKACTVKISHWGFHITCYSIPNGNFNKHRCNAAITHLHTWFCWFCSFTLFFLQSLKRIGTVRIILMFSMSSVFGLVFAILFLKEDIKIYQIGAIAIMISGIYLMTRE
jgi:drug/metabolite transporter (DMT)-like permease